MDLSAYYFNFYLFFIHLNRANGLNDMFASNHSKWYAISYYTLLCLDRIPIIYNLLMRIMFPFIATWNWTFNVPIRLRASWHKCETVHAFRFQRACVCWFVCISVWDCKKHAYTCKSKAKQTHDNQTLQRLESFHSFFIVPAIHRHAVLTHTNANYSQCYQLCSVDVSSQYTLYLLFYFFLFFCSFFGFIRSETSGWVFEAIELTFSVHFIHKHAHTYIRNSGYTYTWARSLNLRILLFVLTFENKNILLNLLLLLLLLLLLVCQSNRVVFFIALQPTPYSVQKV